jgi:hypothetical protein
MSALTLAAPPGLHDNTPTTASSPARPPAPGRAQMLTADARQSSPGNPHDQRKPYRARRTTAVPPNPPAPGRLAQAAK